MNRLLAIVLALQVVLVSGCDRQARSADDTSVRGSNSSIQSTPSKPSLSAPAEAGEIVGRLVWNGETLDRRTAAGLSLWIRDEVALQVVEAMVETNGDRFRIRGLPAGRYLIVATVDANPDNGRGHPGDFYGSRTLDFDGHGTTTSISVAEMIHLLEPLDNDHGVDGWDAACGAKPSFGRPTVLRWTPLIVDAEYVYAISRGGGGGDVVEGRTTDSRLELDLPVNDDGECYHLRLSAWRDGRRIGGFLTHGTHGGRAGFAGFRVAEVEAESTVPPRFDPSRQVERFEEPLIALTFDEDLAGPGLQLAAPLQQSRWVEGPRSRALWIEGAAEWSEEPAIELPSSYTFSVLIRPDALPEEGFVEILRCGLFDLSHRGTSQHLAVFFPRGGHLSLSMDADDGWIEPGHWQHLAIVKNVGVSVWIDGRQVATSSATKPISMRLESLRLGSRSHAETPWRGAFDELRIYDRALDPEEIVDLARRQGHRGDSLELSSLP